MRLAALIPACLAATIGMGQVEEAQALVARPMNSAAITRAMELTESGDAAAKLILFEHWGKSAKLDAALIFALPSRVDAREIFCEKLMTALTSKDLERNNELRRAALTAIIRLSYPMRRIYGDILRDGSSLEDRATQVLRAITPERQTDLLEMLGSSEHALFQAAVTFLNKGHEANARKACFDKVQGPDFLFRRVALVHLIKGGISTDELKLILPYLDDPSSFTRGMCRISNGLSEEAKKWLMAQPYGELPVMARIARAQMRDPESLTDTDGDVLLAAMSAYSGVEVKPRLDLFRRALASPNLDLISIGSAVDRILGSYGLDTLQKEINAAPLFRQGRMFLLQPLPLDRLAASRAVKAANFVTVPVTFAPWNLPQDPEIWLPTAETFLSNRNAESRRLGAHILALGGLDHTPQIPSNLLKRVLQDPDTGVLERIWWARIHLPAKDEVAVTIESLPRLSRRFQFQTLNDCRDRSDQAAQALLTHYARSSDSQLAELAARVLSAKR